MGGHNDGSDRLAEQLRPLVDFLRANESRATSIEAQERLRDVIELFEEYDASHRPQSGDGLVHDASKGPWSYPEPM